MTNPYAPLRVVPVLFAAAVFAKSNTKWAGVLSLVTSEPVLFLDVALIATQSLIVYPFVSPIVEIAAPIVSYEDPLSYLL